MKSRRSSAIATAMALAAGLAFPATAQHAAEGHGGAGHETPSEASAGSPSAEAYRKANMAMHAEMEIDFTGDPDDDFARGMIGHHRGAIAMAEIAIAHGSYPELRALAEEIIAAQEAEVAFLESWLAEHGAAE